jgi:hypothetical protein
LLYLPDGNWNILIVDAAGRVVLKRTTWGVSPFELSRNGLPIGVYQLRLQLGDRMEVLKLVVD